MNDVNLDEARVEAITAGLLMILLAAFLFTNISDSLVMLAAGLVLLGSGVYQSQRGWHVGLPTWILGVVFVLAGAGVRLFLVAFAQINYVAIVLLAVGVYLVWQNFFRRR